MLSKWETLFLLIMIIAILGHVVITPLMIDIAGRDGWISIFLSLPLALFFAFAIYRLRLNYPDEDIFDIVKQTLGPPPWNNHHGCFSWLLFISDYFFLCIVG